MPEILVHYHKIYDYELGLIFVQLLQEGLVILGRLEDFLTLPELADLPQSQEKIEINSDKKCKCF